MLEHSICPPSKGTIHLDVIIHFRSHTHLSQPQVMMMMMMIVVMMLSRCRCFVDIKVRPVDCIAHGTYQQRLIASIVPIY